MVESEKPSFSYEKVTNPISNFCKYPTVQKASTQINNSEKWKIKGGGRKLKFKLHENWKIGSLTSIF